MIFSPPARKRIYLSNPLSSSGTPPTSPPVDPPPPPPVDPPPVVPPAHYRVLWTGAPTLLTGTRPYNNITNVQTASYRLTWAPGTDTSVTVYLLQKGTPNIVLAQQTVAASLGTLDFAGIPCQYRTLSPAVYIFAIADSQSTDPSSEFNQPMVAISANSCACDFQSKPTAFRFSRADTFPFNDSNLSIVQAFIPAAGPELSLTSTGKSDGTVEFTAPGSGVFNMYVTMNSPLWGSQSFWSTLDFFIAPRQVTALTSTATSTSITVTASLNFTPTNNTLYLWLERSSPATLVTAAQLAAGVLLSPLSPDTDYGIDVSYDSVYLTTDGNFSRFTLPTASISSINQLTLSGGTVTLRATAASGMSGSIDIMFTNTNTAPSNGGDGGQYYVLTTTVAALSSGVGITSIPSPGQTRYVYFGYPTTNTVISSPTTGNSFTVPVVGDSNYSSVTLLLHADNALTDNSPLAASIANNSAVTYSTSIKKFGAASFAFNNGHYISTPASLAASYAFGSANFTIEMWVRFNTTTYPQQRFFTNNTAWGANAFNVTLNNGYFYMALNGGPTLQGTQRAVNTTAWFHYALVRNGTSYVQYVDGYADGSGTSSTNPDNGTSGTLHFGRGFGGTEWFNGYLDDIRVTKGVARYTANFNTALPTAAYPDS